MTDLRLSPANTKLAKLEKHLATLTQAERVDLLGPYLAAAWDGQRLRIESWAALPGVTCPGASECRASVRRNRSTGQRTVVDGPDAEIRCYAASMAAQFTATYELWAANTRALRQCTTPAQFADKIGRAIGDSPAAIIRAGISGDIYSAEYAAGLMIAAAEHPDRVIYGYTKSIPFFQQNASLKTDNLRLSASLGSRFDRVAHENGWRTVSVIGHENQASGPVDTNDLQALRPNTGGPFGGQNFHLVIHGAQRPNSWGGRALVDLKRGKTPRKAMS